MRGVVEKPYWGRVRRLEYLKNAKDYKTLGEMMSGIQTIVWGLAYRDGPWKVQEVENWLREMVQWSEGFLNDSTPEEVHFLFGREAMHRAMGDVMTSIKRS